MRLLMHQIALVFGMFNFIVVAADAQLLPEVPDVYFKVFDGTLYSDKPDLKRYGIDPIMIVY